MAELQHDRTLGQTVTHTFAFDGGEPLEAAAFVSIRLWLDRPNQPSGNIFRDPLNPAVCLAIDTLVASGGKVVPDREDALIVTFADVFTGILGARRLQWAFEGLSEATQFTGVAAAVVVHSSQDLPPGLTDAAVAGPLENALPGQVLLSEGSCRVLDNLHVMSYESTSNPAFQTLLWQRSNAGVQSAADEQALFRNIKEQGYSDVRASARHANDALGTLAVTVDAELPGNWKHGGSPFSHILTPLTGLFRRSPWLVWSSSVFAALCVAGLITVALHRAPKPIPVPVQPAHVDTSGAALQKSPGAPEISTAPSEHTVTVKPQAVKVVGPDPARSPHPKEAPEVAKASESTEFCGTPVDRILKRAEDSMNAGRFDEAGRDYAFVLKCDRNNTRATIGLERLNAAKRLQRR